MPLRSHHAVKILVRFFKTFAVIRNKKQQFPFGITADKHRYIACFRVFFNISKTFLNNAETV
jgi:hypothetical protein